MNTDDSFHDRRKNPYMQPDAFAYLVQRMDNQDEVLRELINKVDTHLSKEEEIAPALDQMVVMWKGTRLAAGILIGVVATLTAFVTLYEWIIPYVKADQIWC